MPATEHDMFEENGVQWHPEQNKLARKELDYEREQDMDELDAAGVFCWPHPGDRDYAETVFLREEDYRRARTWYGPICHPRALNNDFQTYRFPA